MKNLEFVAKEDVFDYMLDLWETPEFVASQLDENGFIYYVVSLLEKLPRAFFETSRSYEHAHFTSWFNFTAHRTYDNPYLHDLYYLHELYHLATMTYDELDFYSWYEKMVANEVESALVSEVFVYIFLKNEGRCIRSKTFDFEIWADRFLALDWSHVTVENFRSEFSEVFAQRRAVMNGILVRDAVEKKLSRFGPQNFAWARVWQEKYAYVEKCMREFSTDEDLSKLYAEFSLFEEEGVLFDSEARAFDRVNERFHSQFGKLTEGCEREMHLQ